MYSFLPDMYVKSIYQIDYKSLKNSGIKVILFDLDNTIVPISAVKSNQKLRDLFEDVRNMGLRPIIMSNSGKKEWNHLKMIYM